MTFNGYDNQPASNSASKLWWRLSPIASPLILIVFVLVVASFINAFVFQSYYVEGASMQPTLHDEDRLVVGKAGVSMAELRNEKFTPERGDIVVIVSNIYDLKSSRSPQRIIKRVIGLPGDRISVNDGKVKIFNNDHPDGLEVDKQLGLNSLDPTFSQYSLNLKLSNDEIFVLGDNRALGGSLDSRNFGAVKLDQIEGTLWARMFPLDNVRAF